MRNPDSLDVGEPGCKDNIELQHLNRSSLHFASLLSPAYWDRAWWRVEARRVGSDSPSVPDFFAMSLGSLLTVFQETCRCKKCLILLARPKRFELLTH